MKIVGFMPTLGRPELVQEILMMWHLQTYQDRELLIYDTANQMPEIEGDRWKIIHQGECPYSMGTTCNVGIRMSDAPLICRIDDDDQYAPWHLEATVAALEQKPWCCPYHVWDAQFGRIQMFESFQTGRAPRTVAYAGAWGFTREAFEALGGYRENDIREQECEFRDRLARRYGDPADTISERFPMPSYLYAANHGRVGHYGRLTDRERRQHQRKEWPKWKHIEPRWPKDYFHGLPLDPPLNPRRF